MPSTQTPQAPAPWVQRFAERIPPSAHVLDLACGSGRHTRFMLARGHRVTAVDRDVGDLEETAPASHLSAITADLEAGPWPFADCRFDAVIVCNYLHRPLFRHIAEAVAPGGVLLYSTFACGNERFGHPRNPDFLLRENELLWFARVGFTLHAFEHGRVDSPRPAIRQSLYATRRG